MKLYAVIYSARDLVVKMSVSPRALPQKYQDRDAKIIKRHKSKAGFESIIFDPLIGIAFEKKFTPDNTNPGVLFHIHYTYQVINTLTKVYESMIKDKKMCVKDGSQLVMDRVLASRHAKRVPSFTRELRITPTIVQTDEKDELGISLSSEAGVIADISYTEARLLIESLEHFDTITASLVVGLLEEINGVHDRLDIMQASLDDIRKDLKMLVQNNNKAVETSGLNWKPARPFY